MKGQRSYFSCSVGERGQGYDKDNLNRIIENKAFVLDEGAREKTQYHNIKPGDIILLKYNQLFIDLHEIFYILSS